MPSQPPSGLVCRHLWAYRGGARAGTQGRSTGWEDGLQDKSCRVEGDEARQEGTWGSRGGRREGGAQEVAGDVTQEGDHGMGCGARGGHRRGVHGAAGVRGQETWCSPPPPHRHPVSAELLCVECPGGRQVRDLHGSFWICLPQPALPHRDRHAVEAQDLPVCLPEEAGAGEWFRGPPHSTSGLGTGGCGACRQLPLLRPLVPPQAPSGQRLSGRPPSCVSCLPHCISEPGKEPALARHGNPGRGGHSDL